MEKKTQISQSARLPAWMIVVLGLLALAVRAVGFNTVTSDYTLFLKPWYDFIAQTGVPQAFAANFSNYTPPYLYLLAAATLVPGIPALWAVKLISVVFDLVAAAAVYKIARRLYPAGDLPWLGAAIFLFTPAVFIESGAWGQCDIIFTAFLLWSLYALLQKQYPGAVLWFSAAFAFKLQAVFFAPVLLLFVLRKQIRPAWLLAPAGVYLLAVLPAWLMGRPLGDLLTIYLNQSESYQFLSINGPNPYIFINAAPISPLLFDWIVRIGVLVAGLAVLAYLWLCWTRQDGADPQETVLDAAFLTLILPFLLPKMHERYIFTACVLITVLMILDRRYFVPSLLLQAASFLCFLPYMGSAPVIFVEFAAVLNLAVIVWLLRVKIRSWKPADSAPWPAEGRQRQNHPEQGRN